MARHIAFLLALANNLLLVSGQIGLTDFSVLNKDNYAWNQSEWSLTTTKYHPGQFQSRMSLANGYIGASLAAAGPFFEEDVNPVDPYMPAVNGWPLNETRVSFSTISGFYDVHPGTNLTNYPWLNQYGYESFGAGIPHPTSILFSFEDETLDATTKNTSISNFSSKMTYKGGVGEWSETWTPTDSDVSLDIHYTVFFSRVRPNVVAVSAEITPSGDINGTVTDLLDGRSALRSYLNAKGMDASKNSIYTSVHPTGLAHITAFVVSELNASNPYTDLASRTQSGCEPKDSNMTIGQTFDIYLKKGETATFYKYIGAASTDKFADPETTARVAQQCAMNDGFEALKEEHVAAWTELLSEDKVDDFRDPATGELPDDEYIQALHISSVVTPYYLLQNLQPVGSGLNDGSIAVGGLVSDSYAALIFWDADYWMAPGLNIGFPKYSQQIANFPIKQFPQALKNAAFNNWPNGSALYPWTAGRYGNCTGTGPCVDYEYHKNYDIAFNLLQIRNVTNNDTWFNDGPRDIIDAIAVATSYLLQYNETTDTYWIHNMTDPDEFANNKDNGAFTIASAAKLLEQANNLRLEQGLEINETWATQSKKIQFPVAPSGITLEYQTMNDSVSVKQADVVLLPYPLGYSTNYTPAAQLLDLDYYANKQSSIGPAMTYGIFAAISNALSHSGSSTYTYGLQSVIPYSRAPWFQMSEQNNDNYETNGNTNPAFPFLTGHGGFYQVVPFGWLGLRTDRSVMFINPSIPPQISTGVRVRKFHYAGATISATMNLTHTNVTRHATPKSAGLQDKYVNTTMPFMVGTADSSSFPYKIGVGQTITISNRLYWQNLTFPGNLLQNLQANSLEAYAPGQFPVAAVDGATSTRWQPASNESASLIVNMTTVPFTPIKAVELDWGTRPPLHAFIFLSNTSQAATATTPKQNMITLDMISPSLPYDATAYDDDAVEPVVGNMTTFNLATPVWSGKYATLVIEGCWIDDGMGATVGEFVLVSGS